MCEEKPQQRSQPSIKKNYIFRMSYEVLALIMPFITAPYISRVLGADGVGIYSYTSSIMTYFTMFAALGTEKYGEREIARSRDNPEESSRLFFEIETLSILTSSVCIIAWIFVILFSNEYRWYFLAQLPLLFGTMFNIAWYFTGLEKVSYTVVRNLVFKLVGTVLLFVLVKDKNDLLIYIWLQSLITLAGNLSMWFYLPRMMRKVDFRTLKIKRHFKETIVYFVPTIATSIYTVLDKTLIGLITKDSYQNGYYEQASKIVNIVKAVVNSINSVMGARISYLVIMERYDEIKQRIGRTLDFIFLLGVGSVFGIWGIAGRFVPLFFGASYEPVISLLCLMCPLILIIGVSGCLTSQYYTPFGLRAECNKYVIAAALCNLVLNLCFIPFLGATGAVISSVVAESIIVILCIANCKGYVRIPQMLRLIWKRLIAGALMYFIVWLIGHLLTCNDIIILCLQVALGLISYFLILFIMNDSLVHEVLQICIDTINRLGNNRKA